MKIRNIGIIAHVDHGKTTLVDRMLQHAGTFRVNQQVQERAMDSMDLEREKGITIKSKNASVTWRDIKINIVDTPGHADFGGEVERILNMVDGVLLLVDAVEGPQAQTRFVLRKAIEHGLRLVVLINKIDRDQADPERVHERVLELLLDLHANEEQFHAPFLYGSARDGYVMADPSDEPADMTPLFQAIIDHIPPPQADPGGPLLMMVSNLDWSDYVGRIAIGKILAGRVVTGQPLYCVHRDGKRERGKAVKLFTYAGLGTAESDLAEAGNIVGIAGFDDILIGETVCGGEAQAALPFTPIDPPTIQMQICVNDGPLAGQDGKHVTSRKIGERLHREARGNVSIDVTDTNNLGAFLVSARGELQIAVLVETMRREGFEVLVSRPEVITRVYDGKTCEPYEELWLEVPEDHLGDVIQFLNERRGRMTHMEHQRRSVLIEGIIPTRGLIGFESWLTNLTSGEGILSHLFKEYAPHCGPIPGRATGALVSTVPGDSTAYALDQIQERGRLFIGPQERVYAGMIVGENARAGEITVNPTRTKQLTNIRASGTDKAIQLEPPVRLSLERAIEFIAEDEYVEVTPHHLRLRKKLLDPNARKRALNRAAS